MSYWGKLFGGMAGFAMGGPPGAVMGAALGHAADMGAMGRLARGGFFDPASYHPARLAALFAPKEQVFAMAVVALSAKLAKCDGPVSRIEIDTFKRSFNIPDHSVQEIGRLFDSARDNAVGYETYAIQLGQAFSDNRGVLEQVMVGLLQIARADGPLNGAEAEFLARVAQGFGVEPDFAQRAGRGAMPQPGEDPYATLGISRNATNEEIRARWKTLMRENHPDSLASRGVPPAMIAAASDRVARINAAYDAVKRERRL